MPTNRRLLTAPLIVMFGVIVAMMAFALPANAAPYATQPVTSVSDQSPAAGSSLEFCGSGFAPGETVTIALDNGTTFPSVTADSSGAFCTTLVLGASLSGTYTVVATGATSGSTSSTTIQVAGVAADNSGDNTSNDSGTTANNGSGANANNEATSNGELAFTGAAVVGIGALGALLLIGGALMVLPSRRRKVDV